MSYVTGHLLVLFSITSLITPLPTAMMLKLSSPSGNRVKLKKSFSQCKVNICSTRICPYTERRKKDNDELRTSLIDQQ